MPHPIEAAAQALIAGLHRATGEVAMPANDAVFLPGLWSSFDAEEGALSGRYVAGGGALLRLTLAVERPGRWCSLSMDLGDAPLAEGDVLGLVAELQASRPDRIGLSLRAIRGDQHSDLVFDEGFALTPSGDAQAALLEVPPGSVLCESGHRLALLLELPQTDLEIVIRDMRLFVLPAAEAMLPDAGLALAAGG